MAKISPSSTTTELLRMVNTLRSNQQQRPVVFKKVNGFTDNPEEAAKELSKYYSEESAASSYLPSFQMAKAERECMDTGDVYNIDTTLAVLLWALDKGLCASIGVDSIGYPLLQRLTLSVKMTLLDLLKNLA